MILLFNGTQSSLSMVHEREMGRMRLLLTAPVPRWWMLASKLLATAVLSLVQVLAFVAVETQGIRRPVGLSGRTLQSLYLCRGVDSLCHLRQGPGRGAVDRAGDPALCFGMACWGYDPQRGFGALSKRGGGSGHASG